RMALMSAIDREAEAAVLADTRDPARSVAPPSTYFCHNVAVIFGIDTYSDGIPCLRSAVKDATAIATALQTDHGFSIELYCDAQATRATLLSVLQGLSAKLGVDSRLIFYFAGHGV